jgi:putative nucleotidyltransferase with HDIG domain
VAPESIRSLALLIVDDNPANVRLLERILANAGFTDVTGLTNPGEVLPRIATHPPDLILLDLMMPEIDGFAVMAALPSVVPSDAYLPVLVLTADTSTETRRRALAAGAHDFLTKPFDPVEVELRISNLLATRSLHVQLRGHAQLLEQRVHERTADLEEARLEILQRLALAAEFRDDATGQHTQRVGRACAALAAAVGRPPGEVEDIRRAAPLHDIGKIGIPDAILLKPARLTPEEWAVMRSHTVIGARILSGSNVPVLQVAERIAISHHERWNGSGYPQGLHAEEIPLEGRILAVVDVFDALTSPRPYKPAWPVGDALEEIRQQKEHHFDPRLVDAFDAMLTKTNGSEWSGRWSS